jgi:hypothetical protein
MVRVACHVPIESETDNNPFISLGGENPEVLFTDEELRTVDAPWLDQLAHCAAKTRGFLGS